MTSQEWVSWFVNGEVRHYRADSVTGQEIMRRLAEAEAESGRLCPAPKPLFPAQACGNRIVGRKGHKYCSKACALRAQRAGQ